MLTNSLPPWRHPTKTNVLYFSFQSSILLFSYSAIQLFSYSAIQLFSYSAIQLFSQIKHYLLQFSGNKP
ncbi:hypothetical protein AIB94_25250 [Salmonella enterica subsp. enterica serovar Muenchen]|nr:hypothetical protein [Salmonella enterica subsp. enterica serovar Muenchen]ECZ7905091.1 hypothetical protein [Salmonella enterica subsp. enterica serovar Muenchen]EEK7229001.1 hypothetical protein [Salmonella enterica subsp. enterica serovar Muenchen]